MLTTLPQTPQSDGEGETPSPYLSPLDAFDLGLLRCPPHLFFVPARLNLTYVLCQGRLNFVYHLMNDTSNLRPSRNVAFHCIRQRFTV